MKVGVDATALVEKRTGVGNYIYELLVRIVKEKNDWQFILYSNSTIFFPDFTNVRCCVTKPKFKGALWQNFQLLPQLFFDRNDVYWGGNGLLPIVLPKCTRTILTVHDLVYRQAGATMPFYSRYSRRLCQPMSVHKSDTLVAVSRATDSEMKEFYHRSADEIIHPQMKKDFFPANEAEKLRVKRKYLLPDRFLLVIGTLEPRKNLVALMKAYKKSKALHPRLPLLAMAGGKGWLSGELPELVSDMEASGIVKKLGYVADEDMCGLYSSAELFILPSLYEGFGMPVVEAQLCGTPVAISAIPSLLEASGGVGCSFEPRERSIEEFLSLYGQDQIEIPSRDPSSIPNNPDVAAEKMASLIADHGASM